MPPLTPPPALIGALLALLTTLSLGLGLGFGLHPDKVGGSSGTTITQPVTKNTEAARLFGGGQNGSLERHRVDDPFTYGEPDAPVTMVIFADPTCPYCIAFMNHVLPTLVRKYVPGGTLRIEFNSLMVHGTASVTPARALRAAAEQGHFWQFHTAIYESPVSAGLLDKDDIVALARKASIPDLDLFRARITDETFDDALSKADAFAIQHGVNSTPTIFINNDRFDSTNLGQTAPAIITTLSQMIDNAAHTVK